METKEYITLEVLAASTLLPQRYLRDLANTGKIPYLNVNGRRRFNPAQVQIALDEIAKEGGANAEK